MKIAIASDHAGFEEKERLKPLLNELGIQFEDLGTGSPESVDYPDFARKVGEESRAGERRTRHPGLRFRNRNGDRRQQGSRRARRRRLE